MFRTKLDLQDLIARVLQQPKHLDDSGTWMLYGPEYMPDELFKDVIDEAERLFPERVKYLMCNILPPNTVVPIHTDTLSEQVTRRHLPIRTNKHSYFWSESKGMHRLRLGLWSRPINYSERHTILNFGDESRIHFVVDMV